MRLHRHILLLVLVFSGCASLRSLIPASATPAERLAATVTIVRDEWGVPHILGESDASVAFGAAYAQAEDAYFQIEEAHLRALGRAAHWYGERLLASDLLSAALEVERLSREEYEREPPDRRAVWDAFAEGLNHYVRTSGVRPRLITNYEPWMPFALARSIRAGTLIDGVRLGAATDRGGPQEASSAGVWEGTGSEYVSEEPQPDGLTRAIDSSFMWAVTPSRAEAGNALLLHGAAGAFFEAGQPYELLLLSSAGWHVRGSARLGTPVPESGRNSHIAWGHARTRTDYADVYEVTFDHPTDPLAYRFDGEWRRAVEWVDTLLVNSPEGVVERIFRFRRTHHGPVVAERNGRSLALRVARMEEGGSIQQLYVTGRARSLDEFRAALDLRALAAATMYADIQGNILFMNGNVVPVRDTMIDWTHPVDGNSSVTEWRGFHEINELPQDLNPADGWLAYSVTGTSPASAAGPGFPRYMAPVPTPAAAGGATRLPDADTAWTFDEWIGAAFDAAVADPSEAVTALVHEWEEVGGPNPARARGLDAAVDLLRGWDQVASVESEATTVFVLWQEQLRSGAYTGELARFRALEAVIAQLERDWNRAAVPWGEINRLQRIPANGSDTFSDDRPSLPAAGAPGWLGSRLALSARSETDTRMRYAVGGTRWIHAAELARNMQSRTVVTFGQSADPASPHGFDQAPLFTQGRLKNAWFNRAEIMANARRVYQPAAAAVRELP
jgi:penicillin amidase